MILSKSQPSESIKHNYGEKEIYLFFRPKYVGSQRESVKLPTSTELQPESHFSDTPWTEY